MDLMRIIDPALLAAMAGPSWHPIVLVYLNWPDLHIRAHSGVGSITWGGELWLGVGQFGRVELPGEVMSGLPADFRLSLVCDLADLADYADANIRNRPGTIYLGATTTAGGNVLIGDPMVLTTGGMDTSVLQLDFAGDDTLYQLTVGFRTGPGFRTAPSMTHSHEDQSARYPSDTGGLMLRAAMARAEKTLWPEA